MFFLLLSMILLTGMLFTYFIIHGMTMEAIVTGLFLVFLLVYTIRYYRKRKKKKREAGDDCGALDCFYFECPSPGLMKKIDCDAGDCDCDCSP